jgi:rSAM/selenodomain-associated transferase 2
MPVSIIIPVLNEAGRIAQLLDYLQEHGGNDIAEIIVVDGYSSDHSGTIAQKAGAVVIQSTACRAAQMNAGAKIAKGDILYFVHADTIPPANYAAAIQRALHSGWSMGCFRYRFDAENFLLKANAWFTRFHFLVFQGGDKTFFITKKLFNQLNGYDEKYTVMEEYDFLRRATKSHLRFTVLPETVIVSARKYENRPWLKVQLANLAAFNLWRWELAKPEKIKAIYKKLLG